MSELRATTYRLPWSLLGAPGVCYDINGDWWHLPGSCEFCAKARGVESMHPTTGHLSHTSERYGDWLAVFDADVVHLKSPTPILAELPGGLRKHVYLLDLESLTEQQRDRLVAHLSRRFGHPVEEVRADLVRDGLPILCDDITVTFDRRLVV